MDFALPADLVAYLGELDRFIAREIKPIEEADDNIRFFDHRREWARTDFDHGGLPRKDCVVWPCTRAASSGTSRSGSISR